MQIPIPYQRGQRKPYGSIPRINWSHPLTRGLKIYTYDVGGPIIDLVNGGMGANRSVTGIRTSAVGTGIAYPTTGWSFLPANRAAAVLAATVPYTVAMAAIYTGGATGGPGAVIVGNAAANNNTDGGVAFTISAAGTGVAGAFNNGANQVAFNALITSNKFQTWVIAATTSTTATYYANGILDKSATGIGSTTFDISSFGGQVMYNTATNNAVTFGGGIVGFIPYFAAWNRILTANEARVLHDDPYCFLIYPEDDMFALLVGTTVTPPGGGPNFLDTTLQMMGVG